jgi:hypothetical protein
MVVMSMIWLKRTAQTAIFRGATRSVLRELADMANEEGQCWPSLATLAKRAGVSRRQVMRSVKELENGEIIWVDVERRVVEPGMNLTNLYTLKMLEGQDDRGGEERSDRPSPVVPHCRQEGDAVSSQVLAPGLQGSVTRSPEPSLNPPLEPRVNRLWDCFLQQFKESRLFDIAKQIRVEQRGETLALLCPAEDLLYLQDRMGSYVRRHFAPYVQKVEFLSMDQGPVFPSSEQVAE